MELLLYMKWHLSEWISQLEKTELRKDKMEVCKVMNGLKKINKNGYFLFLIIWKRRKIWKLTG